MTLKRLFKISRCISYVFKGLFGCSLVALLMFDPDHSIQEYVPLTYAILFGTLFITGVVMWITHDITRVTRWIEPAIVCLLAAVVEVHGIFSKEGSKSELLSNAHVVYEKCGRSMYNTYVTCLNVYDQYAEQELGKLRSIEE